MPAVLLHLYTDSWKSLRFHLCFVQSASCLPRRHLTVRYVLMRFQRLLCSCIFFIRAHAIVCAGRFVPPHNISAAGCLTQGGLCAVSTLFTLFDSLDSTSPSTHLISKFISLLCQAHRPSPQYALSFFCLGGVWVSQRSRLLVTPGFLRGGGPTVPRSGLMGSLPKISWGYFLVLSPSYSPKSTLVCRGSTGGRVGGCTWSVS
jgi:hypothetical protein